MILTKKTLFYFSEKGKKQKRRMQLALSIGVSFDTINRYLDQDNLKLDSSRSRNALSTISGIPNDELFEKLPK